VSQKGGFGTHARRCGRGFTAGVAAADNNDVEARIHGSNLEWAVLPKQWAPVKICCFANLG
jgi:hypothetical protein